MIAPKKKKKSLMEGCDQHVTEEEQLANDPVLWGEMDGMDASPHEEWLLAIVGQLMRREAEVVRRLEDQNAAAGKGRGKGKGRAGGK